MSIPKTYFCTFAYGGLHPEAHLSILQETGLFGPSLIYDCIWWDALISRSRSVALTRFAEETDAEVCFMLDHDIAFEVGDAFATVLKAAERQALVAGLYSVRARDRGVSSRLVGEVDGFEPGADRLWPADMLAAGFLAIPRAAVEAVLAADVARRRGDAEPWVRPTAGLSRCFNGDKPHFVDFFRPFVQECRLRPGEQEYLSEDWAWSARCADAGVDRYVYAKPKLRHYGDWPYTVEELAP